ARLAVAAALVSITALAATSTAQAAQRYASPTGTGKACIQLDPCPLETAIEEAKADDEVIVSGGTYTPAKPLKTPEGVAGIDIHGIAGGPLPTIVSSSSLEWALEFRGPGGQLSLIALEDTAPTYAWGVKCTNGAVVERVRVS